APRRVEPPTERVAGHEDEPVRGRLGLDAAVVEAGHAQVFDAVGRPSAVRLEDDLVAGYELLEEGRPGVAMPRDHRGPLDAAEAERERAAARVRENGALDRQA